MTTRSWSHWQVIASNRHGYFDFCPWSAARGTRWFYIESVVEDERLRFELMIMEGFVELGAGLSIFRILKNSFLP